MRLRTTLRLPKEHGAWGMLYVPFLLGAFTAAAGAGRLVLLGLSTTFLFIGRESVLGWWRARCRGRRDETGERLMWIYLGLAAAFGAPLILFSHLYGMIPLGLAAGGLLVWNAGQAARREERTIFTEVLGIIGLTLAAPTAYYVALGRWEPEGLLLWALSAIYFGGSVFYIRLRVVAAHRKRERESARIRWLCGGYYAVLAALLVVAVAIGRANGLLLAAFAPAIARAFWHVVKPPKRAILQRIGVLEIVYSAWFLIFAVLAFRAG